MLEFFSNIICGIFLPISLILVGIYFLFKLRFFYILHPIKAFKSMCKGGFKSLSVALAGTLGIGNIVGVSSALISGGAGAIFWMWISAFIAMSVKYCEVVLAMKCRKTDNNGNYYGGAPYYIYDGFKSKFGIRVSKTLACIFAFLCTVNSLSTGNLVQINAVSSLVPIKKFAFGIAFALLVLLIILGGIKRISKFTSFLMPILSVIYIIVSFFVIFSSLELLPSILSSIFKEAFTFKSAISGFCGYGIMSAIRYGTSRGLLSNEAGCGTSPCAHASSSTANIHSQGCLGIFEVFIDTIVLCTLTALVILIGDIKCDNAMSLVIKAFEKCTGITGKYIVIISCLLFALATIVCQYYYGIESLKFITQKKWCQALFTCAFIFVTVIGANIPMSLMWQISDIVIATMTILNLFCLFTLRKQIKEAPFN